MTMKKTLVIHPNDRTTDMLKYVYKDHPEYTICRDNGITRNELKELIVGHDKIVMLGHGLPNGLIGSNRRTFLIDDGFASILKEKETVSVWCFSDEYFRNHSMPGFHTGMIISEVLEEYMMLGDEVLNQQEMLENFKKLSICLGKCIDMSAQEMKDYMLENYTGCDAVTAFNRNSIRVLN